MKKLTSLMTAALACTALTPGLFAANQKPLGANFASDRLTVPAMVNTPGNFGAVWQTHVTLMNPTSRTITVQATLYDTTGPQPPVSIALAAGEQKSYENFLHDVFNASGAGAVKFESGTAAGGTSDDLFIMSSENFTAVEGARYGSTLPAFDFPGTGAPAISAGVTRDASSRTNIGCINQSAAENTVIAAVFDGSGAPLGSTNLTLPAKAWGQVSIPVPGGINVTGGYVIFTPAGAATCYSVVINNATNDGHFISAVEYLP